MRQAGCRPREHMGERAPPATMLGARAMGHHLSFGNVRSADRVVVRAGRFAHPFDGGRRGGTAAIAGRRRADPAYGWELADV